MKTLFLANTAIDFGTLAMGSLIAMVIAAVFVIVVQPLVKQATASSDKLVEAMTTLNKTIATSDKELTELVLDTERRTNDRIQKLTESTQMLHSNLEIINSNLQGLEKKIDSKL